MRQVLILCLAAVVSCSGPVSATPSTSASSSLRPSGLAAGGIVEYAVPDPPAPPANCGPPCVASLGSAAAGADGNIWYVDVGRRVVGRISPSGLIAQFAMPEELAGGAQTIAAGPDHSIWVLARGTTGTQPDWILRVSQTGDVAKFEVGSAGEVGVESIAAGSDGNLWFTEFFASRVGRLNPSGALTEFPTSTPGTGPRGIAAGRDGNMWFAETNRNHVAIARITPKGDVTEYPLSSVPSDNAPNDVAVGPDGNLWFTETSGIGHISMNGGEITHVVLPQGVQPRSLVGGPDGNIWFTDGRNNTIGRLGVAGALRVFPLPRRGSDPLGIAVGRDGRIWLTETGGWIASIGVKVPEVLLSGRVVPFIDATSKTVTVTNTGDAVLSITSVRVTGVDSAVFAKRSDTCGGRSFNPGASCVVELARRAGGASGVESAALEIADNATGTPQKVSLVAQLGTCRLPVVARGANQAPQGEFIDMTTGRAVYDPTGAFEVISEPSYSVQTVSRPVLAGNSAGYYDQSARRWLPAYDSAAISPDHASYAYSSYDASGTGNRIHVVEIGTGADRVLSLDQGFWGVVGYTEQGIYANQRYEGVGPGLWLINPDTGATRKVVVSETVDKVSGSTAWLGYWDPQDKAPQPPGEGGADNAILKRDLATGATTRWYYRSGANVGVVGVVGDGVVVNVYDGATSQLFWVPSPGTAQGMAFPFTSETFPSFSGFVGDAMGVWVGSEDGLYLWTARTGGVLVSTEVATPAGTCG